MNGNGRYETETLEALLEDLEGYDEWDESDESDEAAPRRSRRGSRRPPPRTASGTGLGTPRPNTQFVTQTQLQTALTKVGAHIKTNSEAIKTVSSRVGAQTEALTKEVAARKKETEQLKKDLRQTREMSAILPLLSRPSSVLLNANTVSGTTPATGPKVLVESNDTLSTLLPLMLMGGMGGSGSGGGGMFGSGGGDDNGMMMMLVLAMTLGKK